MEIILLGTSSMVPTEERNHSATLLKYKEENILIDCGEGTQRQFRKAKISAMKITKILITHWHGDHVLGLPGLFLTLASQGYAQTLEIYVPKGTKEKLQGIMSFFVSKKTIKYKVLEVESGIFFQNEDFYLEAKKLKHSTICLGYRFVEKDKIKINMLALKKIGVKEGPHIKKLQLGEDIVYQGKKIKAKKFTKVIQGKIISFVSDTAFCDTAIELAKNADILFCESTYLDEMKEQAEIREHMTSTQAATIAKKAKVKKLVLVHFSQRYKDLSLFSTEAKKTFSNVLIGKDLQTFTL